MKRIYHWHHIIPKHRCKRFGLNSEHRLNKIRLTIRQHSLAHKKLWEKYGHWEDYLAWKMLSGQMTKAQGIKFAQKNRDTSYMLTETYRQSISKANKGKTAWNKGIKDIKKYQTIHERGSHYKATPCEYDGVRYSCLKDCEEATGLRRESLRIRPNFTEFKTQTY